MRDNLAYIPEAKRLEIAKEIKDINERILYMEYLLLGTQGKQSEIVKFKNMIY